MKGRISRIYYRTFSGNDWIQSRNGVIPRRVDPHSLNLQGISSPLLKITPRVRRSDSELLFLDMHTSYDPENAQNGNPGSNLAYFPESRIFKTGLYGAFLIMVYGFGVVGLRKRE
jgi:hypothetical protein